LKEQFHSSIKGTAEKAANAVNTVGAVVNSPEANIVAGLMGPSAKEKLENV